MSAPTSAVANCWRAPAPAPPRCCSTRPPRRSPHRAGPSSSPTPPSSPSTRCRTTSRSRSRATRSRRSGRPIRSSRRIRNAEVYDGRGKALLPGPDQLSRASRRRRSPAASTRTSAFPIGSAWRCSPPACFAAKRRTLMVTVGALEAHPHRHHDDRRERRRHRQSARRRWRRPACAACSPSRSATARTWPADVARGTRQERGAAVLGEAARRGPAAHQRSVHRVARQEAGTHQRVPRGRARRERRRPNCCRPSARSPRSTTSATRFTCRRAAPRWTSW